jgi:hypothetical protein
MNATLFVSCVTALFITLLIFRVSIKENEPKVIRLSAVVFVLAIVGVLASLVNY